MAKRRGSIRASSGAQTRTAAERARAQRRLREAVARGVVKKAVGALRQRGIGLRVTGESEVMPLVAGIREVARRARTEEDLRVGVEGLLRPALRQLGVEAEPRYEKSYAPHGSILRGRSDAVYGHLVIEYEPVGALARRAGVMRAAKQLDGYVRAEVAAELGREPEPRDLRRAIGVGLDGERLFFLRYRDDRAPARGEEVETPLNLPLFPDLAVATRMEPVEAYRVVGPFNVGDESVQQFLLYARALRRRPLTAQALADEFGPKGRVASKVIGALYEALLQRGEQPKVKTFFSEWDRIFGIVYGQDLAKAQKDAGQLARTYGLDERSKLKPLLFAVHTYYALLMKLLAAELAALQRGAFISSFVAELPALLGREMRERLQDLENGGLFASLGIRNFLEADFFGWYLAVWRKALEDGVRDLARALGDFEPATGSLEPSATRDLLKRLYQYLVPKEIRHDLGEYYTPDWLAELTLDQSGFAGDLSRRLLDPACGSGTFLVLAIRRARDYADEHLVEPRETARAILANVVGFDLNPIAVIAARTNYLLALGTLVRYVAPLEIPVYLCDSVLTPWHQRGVQQPLIDDYTIPSTVGEFHVPRRVVTSGELPDLTRVLEECVRDSYKPSEFLARARRELKSADDRAEPTLDALFRKIAQLEREGRNGLWARVIKNEFAPVFAGTFDYVVGNPPWVNWESLADDYRRATATLWQHYGLFSLKGHAARLGGGKKDLAMLMLYAAADVYLRDGGHLTFLITQTLFKSKGAGDGFRRFRLGQDGYLKVLLAHDLSELQPFEGATNRTGLIALQKGAETTYPVPYTLWRKTAPGSIGSDLTLAAVRGRTATTELAAHPITPGVPTSPWATAETAVLGPLRRAVGRSAYRGHAGSYTGGLNGVFWLRIVSRRPDGLLVVENLHDVGRTKVRRVQAVIEPDLVYPLLRGRDVQRWRADPSAHILVVQDPKTREGYPERWLKVHLPRTYAYMKRFEEQLREERRSSSIKALMEKGAFYSMYAVAEYTFTPHKVVWREQARELTASAVVGAGRPVVPDHKLMLVACVTPEEAHYVSACLNSTVARLIADSYALTTSTSTHLLEHVAVPTYDAANPTHRALATLGAAASELAAKGHPDEQPGIEAEIHREAAALWGISDLELATMRAALTERRQPRERRALEPQVPVRQEILPLVEAARDQGWLPAAVRLSAELGSRTAQEQRRESEGAEAETRTATDGGRGRISRVSL